MKISEMITDRYKLRIPPTVYYDLLADVQEVEEEQEPKTGHWIEQEGWDGDVCYECSVCREPFCLIDGTPTDNMYNYCPNCGAKMIKPQESEET